MIHLKQRLIVAHEPAFRGFARTVVCTLLLGGFILLALGVNAGEPEPARAGNDSAALAEQIATFSRDLERLRRFMGLSRASKLDIGIHTTIPRDLYFQSLTLWSKPTGSPLKPRARAPSRYHGPLAILSCRMSWPSYGRRTNCCDRSCTHCKSLIPVVR